MIIVIDISIVDILNAPDVADRLHAFETQSDEAFLRLDLLLAPHAGATFVVLVNSTDICRVAFGTPGALEAVRMRAKFVDATNVPTTWHNFFPTSVAVSN